MSNSTVVWSELAPVAVPLCSAVKGSEVPDEVGAVWDPDVELDSSPLPTGGT